MLVHQHQVAHNTASIAHHHVSNAMQMFDERRESRSLVFLIVYIIRNCSIKRKT